MKANSEAYSEPCQTSKKEFYAKIVNGFLFLSIFPKSSVTDVWQDSEFTSEASNDLRKKLPLRCLTGFRTHLCILYFLQNYLLLICLLNLINIFHNISSKCSIAHGQIYVTLYSSYLLNNKNYNSAF